MWRQEFSNEFYKAKMHNTGEGTKALLKSIPSNQLQLIKDTNECKVKQLESTLFLKVFNSQALMLTRCSSYNLLKTALKDYIATIPSAIPKQALNQRKSMNDSETSDAEHEDD
jgi:dGTP triphosphohydrolase